MQQIIARLLFQINKGTVQWNCTGGVQHAAYQRPEPWTVLHDIVVPSSHFQDFCSLADLHLSSLAYVSVSHHIVVAWQTDMHSPLNFSLENPIRIHVTACLRNDSSRIWQKTSPQGPQAGYKHWWKSKTDRKIWNRLKSSIGSDADSIEFTGDSNPHFFNESCVLWKRRCFLWRKMKYTSYMHS